MRLPRLLLILTAMAFAGPSPARAGDGVERPVDYLREVRPILSRSCFPCHGNDTEHRQAGLRLDTRDGAVATLRSGSAAVVPGDPDSSDLIFRITETDDNVRMPPRKAGDLLKPADVETIRRWIAQGGDYAEHWAFVPPKVRPLPTIRSGAASHGRIDCWIVQRLEAAGLQPSDEADRHALLRRVSLDLRGLPPTVEEIARFEADTSPLAYERAVDRLLADPAFGERWARVWLDLARYADSAGYGSDPLRPNMWRFRDWVTDAFNANEAFDQFVIEQIAGDLLPEPTLEQRIATAFHRNTMTNTEGGTDDEEFRAAAIKDRVDTTGQVFMGLTVGCAKCHNHKYDPISNSEYYKLYAFFNQSADTDQPDESPTLPAPTTAQLAERARIDAQVAALQSRLEAPDPALDAAQAAWEATLRTPVAWTARAPVSLKSDAGTTLALSADGVIRASGTNTHPEAYTLDLGPVGPLAAIRLETLPDPSLPGGGAGRAADGNFVLSRIAVESEPAGNLSPTPVGRIVRITLPGPNRMLSLAEVEVASGGRNVAPLGKATQSSTDYDGPPERAIDGNTNGHYFDARSTTHTQAEDSPWWEVTLADTVPIDRITVWNRTDGGSGARLAGFLVQVLDSERKPIWQQTVSDAPALSTSLNPSGRKSVTLAQASADFAQAGFPIAATIQPKADPATGWAVQPEVAKPHTALFALVQPLASPGDERLIVRLEFAFKEPGYTLGQFRLATTDSPDAARRLGVPAVVLTAVDAAPVARSPEQAKMVLRHFRSIAPEARPLRDQIAQLEASQPKAPNLPVMVELPAERRRVTKILNKGNFLDPGEPVEAAVPQAFGSLPPGQPSNRLGLARWLTDPANPLTARVAVNRIWAQLFGTGLVETEEDFGTQGELPSHPELLDTLALQLIDSGWDTKALIRAIVTSATYRQSSKVTPERLEKDPRNRLLSRGPRFRLDAEQVRDQALDLSGLLSRKMGGPSVFPPQPEGLWQAAFNGERTWATSPGDDRHRRGLYTFWRRTVPYPSMATFDAPSREICAVRRIRTNTPLQAFVTLNDPVYVEAAQALGRRLVAEGGATPGERIRYGLTLCLGRPPDPAQERVLVSLFESERARYAADRAAAESLATDPIGPAPAGLDPAELAAWTSVANVLLNLDGVLTKG